MDEVKHQDKAPGATKSTLGEKIKKVVSGKSSDTPAEAENSTPGSEGGTGLTGQGTKDKKPTGAVGLPNTQQSGENTSAFTG